MQCGRGSFKRGSLWVCFKPPKASTEPRFSSRFAARWDNTEFLKAPLVTLLRHIYYSSGAGCRVVPRTGLIWSGMSLVWPSRWLSQPAAWGAARRRRGEWSQMARRGKSKRAEPSSRPVYEVNAAHGKMAARSSFSPPAISFNLQPLFTSYLFRLPLRSARPRPFLSFLSQRLIEGSMS